MNPSQNGIEFSIPERLAPNKFDDSCMHPSSNDGAVISIVARIDPGNWVSHIVNEKTKGENEEKQKKNRKNWKRNFLKESHPI
jgi:hypothetical protein